MKNCLKEEFISGVVFISGPVLALGLLFGTAIYYNCDPECIRQHNEKQEQEQEQEQEQPLKLDCKRI